MTSKRTATTIALLFMVAIVVVSADARGAGNLFEEIKARGKVVVGTEAASYPFEFVQEGKIVGYNKEVLDMVVAGWGVKLDQLDVPFAGLLTGLTAGKYDFVASNLFMTPERAEKFAFTMPTAAVDTAFAKRKGDARVKSVDDLTGFVAGAVTPPSVSYTALQEWNDQLKGRGKGAAEIKVFQSSPEMFLALQNKQIDVASLHVPGILGAMHRLPETFEVAGRFGKRYWSGWITRPEDTALRDAINAEIRKIRDRGDLAKLQTKWFGYTMEIPDTGYLPVAGAK